MDKLIAELEEMSQILMLRLDQVSYEELTSFVDQRQCLIDEIGIALMTETLTGDHKSRLNVILQSDAVIRGRMESLRDEASEWLLQRGQAKVQRRAYESGYSMDSILMDSKK